MSGRSLRERRTQPNYVFPMDSPIEKPKKRPSTRGKKSSTTSKSKYRGDDDDSDNDNNNNGYNDHNDDDKLDDFSLNQKSAKTRSRPTTTITTSDQPTSGRKRVQKDTARYGNDDSDEHTAKLSTNKHDAETSTAQTDTNSKPKQKSVPPATSHSRDITNTSRRPGTSAADGVGSSWVPKYSGNASSPPTDSITNENDSRTNTKPPRTATTTTRSKRTADSTHTPPEQSEDPQSRTRPIPRQNHQDTTDDYNIHKSNPQPPQTSLKNAPRPQLPDISRYVLPDHQIAELRMDCEHIAHTLKKQAPGFYQYCTALLQTSMMAKLSEQQRKYAVITSWQGLLPGLQQQWNAWSAENPVAPPTVSNNAVPTHSNTHHNIPPHNDVPPMNPHARQERTPRRYIRGDDYYNDAMGDHPDQYSLHTHNPPQYRHYYSSPRDDYGYEEDAGYSLHHRARRPAPQHQPMYHQRTSPFNRQPSLPPRRGTPQHHPVPRADDPNGSEDLDITTLPPDFDDTNNQYYRLYQEAQIAQQRAQNHIDDLRKQCEEMKMELWNETHAHSKLKEAHKQLDTAYTHYTSTMEESIALLTASHSGEVAQVTNDLAMTRQKYSKLKEAFKTTATHLTELETLNDSYKQIFTALENDLRACKTELHVESQQSAQLLKDAELLTKQLYNDAENCRKDIQLLRDMVTSAIVAPFGATKCKPIFDPNNLDLIKGIRYVFSSDITNRFLEFNIMRCEKRLKSTGNSAAITAFAQEGKFFDSNGEAGNNDSDSNDLLNRTDMGFAFQHRPNQQHNVLDKSLYPEDTQINPNDTLNLSTIYPPTVNSALERDVHVNTTLSYDQCRRINSNWTDSKTALLINQEIISNTPTATQRAQIQPLEFIYFSYQPIVVNIPDVDSLDIPPNLNFRFGQKLTAQQLPLYLLTLQRIVHEASPLFMQADVYNAGMARIQEKFTEFESEANLRLVDLNTEFVNMEQSFVKKIDELNQSLNATRLEHRNQNKALKLQLREKVRENKKLTKKLEKKKQQYLIKKRQQYGDDINSVTSSSEESSSESASSSSLHSESGDDESTFSAQITPDNVDTIQNDGNHIDINDSSGAKKDLSSQLRTNHNPKKARKLREKDGNESDDDMSDDDMNSDIARKKGKNKRVKRQQDESRNADNNGKNSSSASMLSPTGNNDHKVFSVLSDLDMVQLSNPQQPTPVPQQQPQLPFASITDPLYSKSNTPNEHSLDEVFSKQFVRIRNNNNHQFNNIPAHQVDAPRMGTTSAQAGSPQIPPPAPPQSPQIMKSNAPQSSLGSPPLPQLYETSHQNGFDFML